MKIAIIGPESTGKTELSKYLAEKMGGRYHEEIAREYVGQLNRKYTIADLHNILELQVEQYKNADNDNCTLHFFDTEWIITKIWYEWVYGCLPVDFLKIVAEMKFDFYLLCNPDIPWIEDPLRENGGIARLLLYEIYLQNLRQFNFPFENVSGIGEERFKNAVEIIKKNVLNEQ